MVSCTPHQVFNSSTKGLVNSLRHNGGGSSIILECFLTLSNPIFLPTTYSPALICFGQERGWWITCNYPTVLEEKNIEKQKEYNLCYLLVKFHTT
jgi:hypothetical protein